MMRIFLQGTLSPTFGRVACCLKYNGKMQWVGGGGGGGGRVSKYM